MVRHDDRLFVAADPDEGHVYAIEWKTGDVIWSWPSGSGVSSDLMVVEGRVIVVTLVNELVALDAETGDELWRTEGVEGARAAPVTPTPVIVEGDIVWGSADGRLERRKVEDGEVVWDRQLEANVSMDLVLQTDDVILGVDDGRMLRIDPSDGRTMAEANLGAMPAYRWLPAGDNLLVGMTGVSGTERLVVGIDARTLEIKWLLEAPDGFAWTSAQPAVAWGSVLAGTGEPALFAIDPETGDIQWKADVEKSPRTIKVVGKDIYIGTFAGTLLAYRR